MKQGRVVPGIGGFGACEYVGLNWLVGKFV